MDDWQEAAFTTRHVHNRSSKSKAGGGRGRRGGAFEVKKTFGRYDIKCPNARKHETGPSPHGKNGKNAVSPTLDIFRLSDDGRGLLGSLILPGALEAQVILTGSRKTLEDLVSQFEDEQEAEQNSRNTFDDEENCDRKHDECGQNDAGHDEDSVASDNEHRKDESEDQENQDKERSRFKNFEKNSFRSPKFWFQWKGQVTTIPTRPDDGSADTETVETGRGYIVFSGNDCRSFKGTLTCDALRWKDVSISGWKEVSMTERDVSFVWS